MNLLTFSFKIFLLLCLLSISNCGISDTLQRWFPRRPSSNGPLHLEKFVKVTHDDYSLFNETLTHILVPRVPGTKSHDEVAQYIVDYMKKYDWEIEEDKFEAITPFGKKPFNNIIATLNPNGCKKVIFACHYDSKYFENFEFLAASDSAVPCTMILELTRILNDPLKRSLPKDTALQFVFFDGEEAFVQWSRTDSLYGSRHLAQRWNNEKPRTSSCPSKVRTEMARIELFVLLDLIGEADATFCNAYPAAAANFRHLKDIEKRLRKDDLLHGRHSQWGYFQNPSCGFGRIEDDQVPFEQSGLRKILHLIAVPFPGVWHNPNDDATMIDHPTVNNLMKIFRVFLIEHLKLRF